MPLEDEVKKQVGVLQDLENYERNNNRTILSSPGMPVSQALNRTVVDNQQLRITSRDDIINPSQVVRPEDYKNNRKGRAAYQSDLAQARFVAEQQEAAYQEWFNSPEQVAARERAAGRNPDLTEPIGGDASDTAPASGSPVDGIPTNGEVASSVVTGIAGIVSSLSGIASLATSFNAIPLTNLQKDLVKEQIDATKFGNIKLAESAFGDAIMNRLSNAISDSASSETPFDVDAFFSDDKNFDDIYDSFGLDNVRYKDAFRRVREAKHKLVSGSYDAASGTLRSQKTFAESLADPTYDPNVLIQRSYMEPVMEAEFQLRERRAQFEKEVLDIKSQYMDGLDVEGLSEGANAAAYQAVVNKYIADCDLICRKAESNIMKNWDDMYRSHKDTSVGMAASYLIMNRGSVKWYEYLTTSSMMNIDSVLNGDIDTSLVPGSSTILNQPPNGKGGSGYRGLDGRFTPVLPNFIPGNFGDVF